MKEKIWIKRFRERTKQYNKLKEAFTHLEKSFEAYRKNTKESVEAFKAENELFKKRLQDNGLPTHTDELTENVDDNAPIQDASQDSVSNAEA